jgi:uncharacterized membrane protein YedE/YeeE
VEGESTGIEITAATLVAGITIGFVWQRSKACSITGYRDLYLFKDTYLFKTVVGMFLGATVGFFALKWVSPFMSDFPAITSTAGVSPFTVLLILIGGLGFGFFSILSGGCPTKHHVAAASGSESSMLYLVGFYAGIIYFQVVVLEFLLVLFGSS